MKKNLNVFLSICILGTLFLAYQFFNISNNQFYSDEAVPLTGYSKTLNFKPDSVLEFNYKVFGELYKFKKNNLLGEWNGSKNSTLSIQERLSFLSSVDVHPIDRFSDGVIKIKIKFSNQKVWNILSNGHLIRFEDGPLAGKGGKLNLKNRMLFSSGKFAFSERKINWCSSALTEIKTKKAQLIKVNGIWTKNELKNKHASHKIDQDKIKNWLDKNCFIYSQTNLDKRLVRENLDNQIKFKFNESGMDKYVNIKWSNKNIVNIGHDINPIYNKELVVQLNDLRNTFE